MTDDPYQQYYINSILRACKILRYLAETQGRYKITALARKFDLDRSTVYRILLTLKACGVVERNEDTGEFSLGLGAFENGSAYLRTTNLHGVARPIMLDLASKVHQTVHLAVQSGDHAVYLEKIDSPGGLGMISKVGSQIKLHCTGVGKVILAYQPPELRNRLINSLELTKYTENTITDVQSLNARLEEILEMGYGFDRIEHEEDVACIAAPIFGYNGEFLAAISISGSSHRILDPKSQSELIEEALKASRSISEKMGYITTK